MKKFDIAKFNFVIFLIYFIIDKLVKNLIKYLLDPKLKNKYQTTFKFLIYAITEIWTELVNIMFEVGQLVENQGVSQI